MNRRIIKTVEIPVGELPKYLDEKFKKEIIESFGFANESQLQFRCYDQLIAIESWEIMESDK